MVVPAQRLFPARPRNLGRTRRRPGKPAMIAATSSTLGIALAYAGAHARRTAAIAAFHLSCSSRTRARAPVEGTTLATSARSCPGQASTVVGQKFEEAMERLDRAFAAADAGVSSWPRA